MIRPFTVVAVGIATLAAPLVQAENIIGVRESDLHLISFDSLAPATLTGELTLTLPAGVIPLAVDFRPSDQKLYVVGGGPLNTECRLYTVNATTGATTAIGATTYACAPFGAESFNDVDFDPVNDELRVVAEQTNYTVNPGTGVRTTGTAIVGGVDIRETTYDNNVSPPTTTTLYGINESTHTLVTINPATGVATAAASVLGPGVNGGAFDISGASGIAYLFEFSPPFATGTNGKLYTVNLTSGAATLRGKIGSDSLNLLGMTVAPGVTLPSPTTPPTLDTGGSMPQALLAVFAGLALLRRRLARALG